MTSDIDAGGLSQAGAPQSAAGGKQKEAQGNGAESASQSASERARAFLAAREGLDRAKRDLEAQVQADGSLPDGLTADDMDSLVQAGAGGPRTEVSAATIGRMLGLATNTDLQVLEKKLDLVGSRMVTMMAKLEKVASVVGGLPAGADFERIEVQLQTLRSLLKDALSKMGPAGGEGADQQLAKTKIVSNQPQTFGGKVIRRIDPKPERPKEGGGE